MSKGCKSVLNNADITLRDIKEIKTLRVNKSAGDDEVNHYLSNGWIIIDKYKSDDFTLILVIGRVN